MNGQVSAHKAPPSPKSSFKSLSISSSVIGTMSPASPSVQSEMTASGAWVVSVERESVGMARVCRVFSSMASSSPAHEAKNNGVDTVSHRADTRKATFRTLTGAEDRSVWAEFFLERLEITPPNLFILFTILLQFFMSRCLSDSANIKIIIRTAKGWLKFLHEGLKRGIADEKFLVDG